MENENMELQNDNEVLGNARKKKIKRIKVDVEKIVDEDRKNKKSKIFIEVSMDFKSRGMHRKLFEKAVG